MSYYYKYAFTSPEGVYSTVKEEFKSYFDTGAVDDLMFPTYLNKCLNKLGRSSYAIVPQMLYIDHFEARLPDNFYAVREAWLCTNVNGFPVQTANSFYSQAASQTTIQVSPVISGGKACQNVDCANDSCDGTQCMPALIQAVYKTNNAVTQTFHKQYLLRPGNISSHKHCSLDCANFGSNAPDSFDIRDNKFVVNFRHGHVYLLMYVTDYDNIGNQLIPDNYRIKEFVEHFIKYKVVETLTNQVNDETFNQLQQKLGYYKNLADEAYIMAQMEIQKQTANEKIMSIKKNLNSFNKYELPTRTYRYGWRRNGTQ